MPAFPFEVLEGRVESLAESLRWRWRAPLKRAAALLEDDLHKALDQADRPPLFDALDPMAMETTRQAQPILNDALSLAVAAGVWSSNQIWEGQFLQPSTVSLDGIREQVHFQDLAAMQFAMSYGMALVQYQDAAVVGQFKLHLLDSLRFGQSPKKAAMLTAESLGENPAPWERIARTELARAQHMGAIEEARRLGVSYVFVPDHPGACEQCKRLLTNRVFPLTALEAQSNVGKKTAAWEPSIPLHPNCTCVAIPSSASTVQAAREAAGGEIPQTGVRVDALPQPKGR